MKFWFFELSIPNRLLLEFLSFSSHTQTIVALPLNAMIVFKSIKGVRIIIINSLNVVIY